MNAAEKLYKEYQDKLSLLQRRCRHKKISGWVMSQWAPGHSTGRSVKYCLRCNMVVREKKSPSVPSLSVTTASGGTWNTKIFNTSTSSAVEKIKWRRKQ